MSIFDRLGNLGKGIIQSALSPDATAADTDGPPRQAQLKRAFEEGLLTAEEYTSKLRDLSARLAARARGESPPPDVSDPEAASDPVAEAIRKARRATSGAADAPASERSLAGDKAGNVGDDREWEARGPVKRTL
jgi:hypothetical protein